MITLNATYQQTKRVVDAVNGTYQTLLTIDPSVGHIVGTYNCTVENVRGESSKTVVVTGETRTLATQHRHTSVNYPDVMDTQSLLTSGFLIHLLTPFTSS